MAKKQVLSLEEKLEQALVKADEQPYEVPGNWVWTKLKRAILPMITEKPNTEEEYFRYIDIDAIDNKIQAIRETKKIETKKAPSRASRKVESGNVLFSTVRPYLKNIAFVYPEYNGCIASTGFYVCRVSKVANSHFLFYLLCSDYVIKGLTSLMKGDNSPSIRNSDFEEFSIPLPPINEQKRIIATIESLFAKLDRAKELVQSALDSFAERKAAILHQAFSGELTRKWREERGIESNKAWEQKTFDEVCKSITDGDHQPPPQVSEGIPFLVISNIKEGVVDFSKTRFVSEQYYDELSEKRRPNKGDILYSIVGSFGIPAIVENEDRFCFQRHIALFKPQSINSKFLYYLLSSSSVFEAVSKIATGTAQLTVPIKGLRKILVGVPAIEEQQEIVRILDELLEQEAKAAELADVLKRIDELKQTILAKAFRGELGTNDPAEERALELLKSVLQES